MMLCKKKLHPIESPRKCRQCNIEEAPERFWKYVKKTKGCWLWTGSLTWHGYGNFHIGGGKYIKAHIFAYELLVGPVPKGKELHHECPNRRCIRPHKKHVQPLTNLENVRRGKAGKPGTVLKRETTRVRNYAPEWVIDPDEEEDEVLTDEDEEIMA